VLASNRSLARTAWLVTGVLCLFAGCGEASAPEAGRVPETPKAPTAAPGATLVAALVDAPSPEALLVILGQPHAVVRNRLGAHHLAWEAHYETTPTTAPERVAVDQPARVAQSVDDKQVLEWAPGNPERLYLRQGGEEPPACHEYMVVDKQVYTRIPYRAWLTHPLEAEAHHLWLDEAVHGPRDVVAFVAPALAIGVAIDEEAVEVTLRLADTTTPERVATARGQKWRTGVVFTSLDGTIEIDRTTGLWTQAQVEAAYTFEDSEGQRVAGLVSLRGTLEGGLAAEDAVRAAPTEVAKTPNRVRYEVDKHELLDGLIHL
ncbi:MAG: hypothetical protein ACPG4T_06715, partial [Nannocystaceae bacterium]